MSPEAERETRSHFGSEPPVIVTPKRAREGSEDGGQKRLRTGHFNDEDLSRFPALRYRNFWCIQRHQATAHHYDLRLHVRDGLVSWAVPKGMLGLSRPEEASHLAIETTIHPVSYAVHEGGWMSCVLLIRGADREKPGKGTLLWDIGRYTIREIRDTDSDSSSDDDEPEDGAFEEEKLRLVLSQIDAGAKRSFHIILHGGKKMTGHEFALVRSPPANYKYGGKEQRQWLLCLPKGVRAYSWGPGGEEGERYGRSVKSGRSLAEVCGGSDSAKSGRLDKASPRDGSQRKGA